MKSYPAINFREKLSKFKTTWAPKVIAELNDYQFKVVKLHGEFVWHEHQDTDEAFIVLEGKLLIRFRDGEVQLNAGEMFVIPKGVEHQPFAESECKALLVEPKGVVNTGGTKTELTAEDDVWV